MNPNKLVQNFGLRKNHGNIDVDKLTAIIEAAYATYGGDREMQKKSFAPSKLGYGSGKCPRYWYIAFDGANFTDDKAPQQVATMRAGIEAHNRLGDLLERSSLDIVALEEPLEHADPPIFGYIDVIVNRDGELVIGEIKTTRSEAFNARQAKGTPPDYHLIQLLIYMKIKGAESGFFLYENKNTHDLLIMPVYMDDGNTELVDGAFEWMRTVRKSWEDRKLPIIPYPRKNAKECRDCPVFDVCRGDDATYGKGDVKIEPLRLVQ